MISDILLKGSLAAAIICCAVPLTAVIICFKRGKGTVGLVPSLLFGLCACYLATGIASIAGGLIGLEKLGNNYYILASLIFAIILAGFDIGGRVLVVRFLRQMDIGRNRAFAVATGYTISSVFLQTLNYLRQSTVIKMINEGTFAESMVESDSFETLQEAQEGVKEIVDSLANVSEYLYFAQAIQWASLAFLHIALMLIFIKAFRAKKLVIGCSVVAGVRLVYEFVIGVITYAGTKEAGYVIAKDIAPIITALISVLFIVASIFVIIRLMKELPVDREMAAQKRVNTKEAEAGQQSKKAWKEIAALKDRNLSKENDKNS